MTNLIPFPSSNEHDADRDLGQFFAASTVRDDTPMIDPGFATRLANEVTSATQRGRRSRRMLTFKPGLASAALIALILGGMFAMISTPRDGEEILLAVAEIETIDCNIPYRSATDLENLAFIAINNMPQPMSITQYTSNSGGFTGMTGDQTSEKFLNTLKACVETGFNPLSLSLFSDKYILDLFGRSYTSGTSADDIYRWSRSIGRPLSDVEQADILLSMNSPMTYSFAPADQTFIAFGNPTTDATLPGLMLGPSTDLNSNGAIASPDTVAIEPFIIHQNRPEDSGTPSTIGTLQDLPTWTHFDVAMIKPTPEPRCKAGVRSADDMVAIVQEQAVFDQLGGPSDINLFAVEDSIQHLMRVDGADYFSELSACIREGHHPLATTYFDGFYVRELFLRYATTGASYADVVELAESIALPLDRSQQIAYLGALIGVRFELTTGATMEIQSFPAAANADGFIPAVGIGTADRNDPLTPPEQQWRIIDDIILAPVDEIDRRWDLPFGDSDFVVPPWMELPSTS
jgi:hypothetical protein